MPRPRRPFGGMEDIEPTDDPFLAAQVAGGVGTRRMQRWVSSLHWAYRAPNGMFDPLTYLFLLDSVARIDPNIELRAKNLAEWLNLNKTQFAWDPVTVGKVLSDLHDAFEDVLGPKMGLLERGKDYRGTFYRIHHNPATAALYHRLRDELMRLSEAEMALRARGERTLHPASPLLECPSVRGAFNEQD